MKKIVRKDNTILSPILHDRISSIFVWTVWFIMLLVAFACIVKYGRNVPLAEDWYLVAPVTGNEPDILSSLWVQNNEHRVPLPRLIFLLLLKINADFRVGMFFNVTILGIISFLAILTVRYLRGGKIIPADAVFPIALLHLGNWENLVWSWQLSFVFPVVLILVILLLLIIQPTLSKIWVATVAGISLICLPLCGAIGLIFIPFLVPWFSYLGIIQQKSGKNSKILRLSGYILIFSAIITVLITVLYFVGYEKPTWNPPSPGIAESLKTTAKYLALGFGSIASKSWGLFVIAAFGFLLPTFAIAILAVFQQQNQEKYRAWGIIIFSTGVGLLALGIGHGRAGLVPSVGLPTRYVLLSSIVLLSAYFIWELYGKPLQKKIFQTGLLILMCCLIPLNTWMGFQWRNWYVEGMNRFERDVIAGVPVSLLAKRHGEFLIHWWDEEKLAQHLKMLSEANIGIFARINEE